MKLSRIDTYRPLRNYIERRQQAQPFRHSRAAWLSVASALTMSLVMLVGAVSPITHRIEPDFHLWLIVLSNLFTFAALYFYNFWVTRRLVERSRVLAPGLVGSLVIAAISALCFYWGETTLYGQGRVSMSLTFYFISDGTAALISFLIVLQIINLTRQQRMALDYEHLQAENISIRYRSLEQKTSPHFLFNSLNTLDGLIGSDSDRAHAYLHRLAETYRYTLENHEVVSLAEEMEFTHGYIDMMQVRHGEGLRVEENIAPAMLSRQVVPISVQLLVENCIKHNVITQRHPLTITIRTTPAGTLCVSNPVRPKADPEYSSGTGLDNLGGRYKLLFGRDIIVTHTDNIFTVEIPLI